MSKPEEHGAPTITITVFSPKESEGKEFTFPKTKKVGEAATEAALAFGYAAGSTVSFQNIDKKVLDRDKPLVAEHVKDGDSLDIVDVGGGV
jgi:hypothetical protein